MHPSLATHLPYFVSVADINHCRTRSMIPLCWGVYGHTNILPSSKGTFAPCHYWTPRNHCAQKSSQVPNPPFSTESYTYQPRTQSTYIYLTHSFFMRPLTTKRASIVVNETAYVHVPILKWLRSGWTLKINSSRLIWCWMLLDFSDSLAYVLPSAYSRTHTA